MGLIKTMDKIDILAGTIKLVAHPPIRSAFQNISRAAAHSTRCIPQTSNNVLVFEEEISAIEAKSEKNHLIDLNEIERKCSLNSIELVSDNDENAFQPESNHQILSSPQLSQGEKDVRFVKRKKNDEYGL